MVHEYGSDRPGDEGEGEGEGEDCTDGLDNDGDGLTDCEDADCIDEVTCGEFCGTRGDEDDDGLQDCADDDCWGDPACEGTTLWVTEGPTTTTWTDYYSSVYGTWGWRPASAQHSWSFTSTGGCGLDSTMLPVEHSSLSTMSSARWTLPDGDYGYSWYRTRSRMWTTSHSFDNLDDRRWERDVTITTAELEPGGVIHR